MLKIEDCKSAFVVAGLVGILLLASPTLGTFLRLPEGERFSELWILGSGHMAEDYPFNVKAGEKYSLYLGVGNHMGSSMYYVVYVKFRNQTEALPDAGGGEPSSLPPLYEFRFFIEDGENWEAPLSFSFYNVSFFGDRCFVGSLMLNGVSLNVNKLAFWDANYTGYYYQLFFELWIYDVEAKAFQFHNRFVGVWLNMTF